MNDSSVSCRFVYHTTVASDMAAEKTDGCTLVERKINK